MKFFFCFMFLIFFCLYDFFYFFFLLFSMVLILTLSGGVYFGGMLFLDELSFFLCFLSIVIFLCSFFSVFLDFWSSNFFFSFSFFTGALFFFVFMSFFCFNLIFFYLCFELIFVLMFFYLLNWGYSPERLQASFYMVFYTVVVSFPFLVGVVLGLKKGSSFGVFLNWDFYWYAFFFFVFLVKLPVYGVHIWLPKAHVEAPVSGSMILAGVLLKLGGYGILRFGYFFMPFLFFSKGFFIALGLFSGVYSCYLCLRQSDLKAFVAYSSVCHMGFMLGGMLSGLLLGVEGSVMMMVSHGFSSSCLFYLLYVFYERFHTRSVVYLKGLGGLFSMLGVFWFIFLSFNMGVPPSFSFFSEIFLLSSMGGVSLYVFLFSGLVLFFSGCYGMFLYVICFHGSASISGVFFLGGSREYLMLTSHFFYLLYCVGFLSFFF